MSNEASVTKEQQFSIGEVAIYCRPDSPHNGQEVTVAGKLCWQLTKDHVTGSVGESLVYPLKERISSDRAWHVSPKHLRKKHLPREDLQVVRWDTCPWQPEELRV
jgi:hypothetical protein